MTFTVIEFLYINLKFFNNQLAFNNQRVPIRNTPIRKARYLTHLYYVTENSSTTISAAEM